MADGASGSGVRDDRNVCQLCGTFENLAVCSGCRSTWYCSTDHQREDWKLHKRKCPGKRGRKSAQAKQTEGSNGVTNAVDPCSTDNETTVATSSSREGEESKSVESKDKTVPDPKSDDSQQTAGKTEGIGVPVNSQADKESQPVNLKAASTSQPVTPQIASGEEENKKSNPATSGRKKPKSGRKGSHSANGKGQVGGTTELEERYFLDPGVFPQAAQSTLRAQTQHSARLAMAPQGSTQAVNSKDAYLDVMLSRFDQTAKYVVDCLNTYGICVLDAFLGDVNGQEILAEVKRFKDRDLMQQGQVVHSGATSSEKIRGDIITWVDGREQHCENIRYLVSCMDAVVLKCSSLLEQYTINERTKAMVACYPGQATGYVRHVDNPSEDGRCITCIYYLNKAWDVRKDGGMLRIYPEGLDRVADIEPKFDRVLFFWSDRRNPHEVLPSNRERFAITVWYYEAEERARALKKFKGEVSAHPKRQAVPLLSKLPNSQLSDSNSFDASR